MTDHEAIARVEAIEVVEEWLSLVDTFTAQHFSRVRHVPICQGEIDAVAALLDLAKQVGGLREALQLQSYQMNFLSRMADGQKRCERGKGPATWKTTLDAIRSEALVGEAAARAALRQSKEAGECTPSMKAPSYE